MSIKIMTAVWDSNRYESGTLLVLLAMADYANDDDNTCHPSIARLAAKARLSDRQVIRILNRLKEDGVIDPVGEKPTTQGRPVVIYRINTYVLLKGDIRRAKGDICDAKGDTMSPLEPAKGDICDAKGDIHDTLKVTPMSYDPSLEPSIDPSDQREGAATPPPPAEPPAWWEAEAPAEVTPRPSPLAPPTTKSLTQQPAIAIYRDTFQRYPSKPQMALIMAHGIDDLRRWRDVVAHWMGSGWNMTNVKGMLDLYDHPERMAERRSAAQPRPAAVAARQDVPDGWDEFIAKHTGPNDWTPAQLADYEALIAGVVGD